MTDNCRVGEDLHSHFDHIQKPISFIRNIERIKNELNATIHGSQPLDQMSCRDEKER